MSAARLEVSSSARAKIKHRAAERFYELRRALSSAKRAHLAEDAVTTVAA